MHEMNGNDYSRLSTVCYSAILSLSHCQSFSSSTFKFKQWTMADSDRIVVTVVDNRMKQRCAHPHLILSISIQLIRKSFQCSRFAQLREKAVLDKYNEWRMVEENGKRTGRMGMIDTTYCLDQHCSDRRFKIEKCVIECGFVPLLGIFEHFSGTDLQFS